MGTPAAIDLRAKLARVATPWTPRVVAELNDYQVKVVKLAGDFVWHRHDDTDELFIVLHGEMEVGFRDRDVTVREGEMIVVPRGVEHRPVAPDEVHVLLIERSGTPNTGDPATAAVRRVI